MRKLYRGENGLPQKKRRSNFVSVFPVIVFIAFSLKLVPGFSFCRYYPAMRIKQQVFLFSLSLCHVNFLLQRPVLYSKKTSSPRDYFFHRDGKSGDKKEDVRLACTFTAKNMISIIIVYH